MLVVSLAVFVVNDKKNLYKNHPEPIFGCIAKSIVATMTVNLFNDWGKKIINMCKKTTPTKPIEITLIENYFV